MMKTLRYACFILFLLSCREKQPNYLEEALILAGGNRQELEKILQHYRQNPADSLKYKAAVFLIENMPKHQSVDYPDMDDYYSQIRAVYAVKDKTEEQAISLIRQVAVNRQNIIRTDDIRAICAAFLINQIDRAFETRDYPWAQSISWEEFCDQVLPYRVTQEPLEDWRPLYKQRMETLIDSLVSVNASDSLVCATLMAFFKPNSFLWVNNGFPLPFHPSLYLEMNTGNCNDLTLFTQYVMRTAGLPVSYDFTPQWGNRYLGHEWNAITINNKAVTFQINDIVPFGEHIPSRTSNKLTKVYRRMFSVQAESLPEQFPEEDIPHLFRSPLIRDVSEYYFKPFDIQVDLVYSLPVRKAVAYLMEQI